MIELLYKALDSALGVVVLTNDPERLRQKLYAARREAMNPDFESLTFMPSRGSPDTELWIVKRPDATPTERVNDPSKV